MTVRSKSYTITEPLTGQAESIDEMFQILFDDLRNGAANIDLNQITTTGGDAFTVGDLIYASTTSLLTVLPDAAAGSFLRSGGIATAPAWSTTTWPNSATIGDLLYASASNVYSNLADVATGNALISGGVGVAPSWGKIGLTTHVSGVLPIANGGTNATSFTSTRVPFFDGTRFVDDADLTFATDTLSATKVRAPTSVSTPSLISTGSIGITPAAGASLSVGLSTTGDFIINTSQVFADTSTGSVGIGTATPDAVGGYQFLDVSSASTGAMVQTGNRTAATKGYFITNATGSFIGSRSNHPFALITNDAARVTISTGGNVAIGTTTFPSTGTMGLIFGDGTALATMASNTAGDYADSVEGTVERFCINEAGYVSRLTGIDIRKTADESVTDTTMQADDHLLVNLEASSAYYFRFVIFRTAADQTAFFKMDLNGTAGVSSLKAHVARPGGDIGRITAFGSSVADTLVATDFLDTIEGTIEVSTAGTFGLRWAQNAAGNGSGITVQENSSLTLRKLNA